MQCALLSMQTIWTVLLLTWATGSCGIDHEVHFIQCTNWFITVAIGSIQYNTIQIISGLQQEECYAIRSNGWEEEQLL